MSPCTFILCPAYIDVYRLGLMMMTFHKPTHNSSHSSRVPIIKIFLINRKNETPQVTHQVFSSIQSLDFSRWAILGTSVTSVHPAYSSRITSIAMSPTRNEKSCLISDCCGHNPKVLSRGQLKITPQFLYTSPAQPRDKSVVP